MIARQSKKQQGISLAAIALMMVLAQSNAYTSMRFD